MAKVVFCLFGNILSSLVTNEVAEKIIKEEYGIEAIGKSNFPVSICHHELDIEIFPFLRNNLSFFPKIETISTTFSHSLVGISTDSEKKFQIKNNFKGNTDVFFFPDFINPRPNIVKEKFFLYLGHQQETFNPYNSRSNPSLEKHSVLDFDNKIGIPIEGFRNFLSTWNKHAAIPSKKNLDSLINEFEKICKDEKREFVIIPINLEQPYIGSVLGKKLWKIFFSELAKNKYRGNVVSLSSVLEYCQNSAQKKRPPSRIINKWSYYQNQKQLFSEMNEIIMPTDSKKYYKACIIKSIAYSADYFVSIGRRTAFPKKDFPIIKCTDLEGNEYQTELKWNPVLESICNAAREALKNNQKFSVTLDKLDNSFLVNNVRKFANKLSL